VSKVPEGAPPADLNVVARRILLDALTALHPHSDSVTIVGAQAVYLRTPDLDLAVASFTSDADIGVDPTLLSGEPLLEVAMTAAGFHRRDKDQPGLWSRPEQVGDTTQDIGVDLLVAEAFSGRGTRSVTIPPHDRMAARRVIGLEATAVDADVLQIRSLEPQRDPRVLSARVGGVAALLIAKAFKIHQRANEAGQRRLTNKDAGDVLRLMMGSDPETTVAARLRELLMNERTAGSTREGLSYLQELFGAARTQGTGMAVAALETAVAEPTIRAIAPSYMNALRNSVSWWVLGVLDAAEHRPQRARMPVRGDGAQPVDRCPPVVRVPTQPAHASTSCRSSMISFTSTSRSASMSSSGRGGT